jgi:uncharacterized protein (PEP-CTERM system associated)
MQYKTLALFTLCSISAPSIAGDFKIKPAVASTAYAYETETDDPTKSNQAVVVVPSIVTSYSSKRLLTSIKVDHTTVEQKNEDEGADKNYTDYKYNSSLALILNTLNITIGGQQGYRVVDRQQEFIVDRVLAAGELTKYSNHMGTVDFSIPNPEYFGLNIQSSYSQSKTEESTDSLTGINGDNTAASIQLYQGRNARNYTFNFSAQHNDTSRTSFEDFKSSRVQGTAGVSLAQDISFILTGNIDEYDVNEVNFSRRTNLDSSTYGAGIEWQPRNSRILRVTYNKFKEGENESDFVGVNLDWAFSSRTALKFDYSKKFYGDAYSLDFSHALKSVRSSITYREQVTSFARLESTINPIGLFVCQFGSTNLADCFQTESTAYQLQAGEEFRTLSEIGSDISEEVLFIKSGQFNLAYQKRRVKASITASYNKTEYLESDLVQISRNIRMNLSYELGRKTNLSFSTTVASRSSDNDLKSNTVVNTKVDFSRSISNNLQVTTGLGYIKRNSEVESLELQDKRFTMGLNYTF